MNLCGAFENCNYSSRENTSERKRTIQKVYTQLLGQKFAESKTVSMPEQNCMQKLIHFYRAHDARTEHMDKVFFETLAHIFLNVGNSMEDVWELHRDISDACDEEGTLRKLSGLCRNILSGKKSLDYKYEDCYTRNQIRRWRVFHPDSLLVWRSPDISQLTSMLSSGSLEYDDAYEKRLQRKSEDVSRKEENDDENGMGDEYDEDVTIFFRKRKAKRQKVEPSDEKEKVPAYISQDATAEEIDEIQKKIYLVGVPETIYELLPTTDHAVQAVFLRAGAPRDVFELTNFEIPIGSEPNGKKVSRDDSNGGGGVHPQGACDFDGALGILQKKLDCPNGRDETDLPMDTERVSSSGSSEGGVESSNPFITAPVHADRGGTHRKKRNKRDPTGDGAKQESQNQESEGSDDEEGEESDEEEFTSDEDMEVSSGTSQESSSNEEEDTEESSGTSQESSSNEEEDEESDEEEDEEDQEEDEEDQEEDEEDEDEE